MPKRITNIILFNIFSLPFIGLILLNQITINGVYVDKNGIVIENATVEYVRDGEVLATGVTDETGEFTLNNIIVGLEDEVNPDFGLGQNFPNPFSHSTTIPVSTTGSATFEIYTQDGRFIDKIEIQNPGEHEITWGGKGAVRGIYLYILRTGNGVESGSMMKFDGSGRTGLSIKAISDQVKSQTSISKITDVRVNDRTKGETDIIRFTKDNTTVLVLEYEPTNTDDNMGVIEGNVGPEILGTVPIQNINQGEIVEINLNEFVYNDEQSIYQSSNPDFTIVQDSLLRYTGTVAGNFSTQITIVDATDSNLQKMLDVDVNVTGEQANNAPVFDGPAISNDNFNEDNTYQIDANPLFSDVDNPILNYILLNLDTNASYVESNGIITVTPDPNWNGDLTGLIVQADDGEFNAQSNTFDLTVDAVNDAPVFDGPDILNQSTDEDNSLDLDISGLFSDIEGIASYSVKNLGTNVSYSILSNIITFTPNADWNGNITGISIEAKDTDDATIESNQFELGVNAINDAPLFDGPNIGNDNFNENSTYQINANTLFSDIDGDNLSFSLLNLGANASYVENNGIITITPNNNWNGNLSGLVVQGSDTEFNAQSNSFNLSVTPVNQPPVFDGPSISNDNFSEDNDYVIDAKPLFSDVEDITLNYNLLNLGANANYGISNGIITITPNQDWNGNLTGLVIEAEDSGNLKAQSNAFQLTVNPINDAPVFDGPDYGNQSTQKETTFSIPLTRFSDVDNVIGDFSVSFTGLTDASYVINGNNVEITPDNGYVGTMSNVQMTVSDLEPLSDVSDIFDIEVTPPPMTTVDFTFKAAYYDTIMVNGTHTLYWNKVVNPWASDSSRVAVNGVVANVEMEQGLEYEVWAESSLGIESIADPGLISEYTFLRGDAHEQRAYQDTSSPISFSVANASVDVYKLMTDFPMSQMIAYASRLEGSNIGTRRFGDNDLTTATIWWNTNYTASDSTRRAWMQEVIGELEALPHVGLNVSFVESTTAPSQPYLEIRVDSQYNPPSNGTQFNSTTHEITTANAFYNKIDVTKYDFRIEFYQGWADLEEDGGNPDVLEGAPDHNLNTTGRQIISIQYLADPKTKFNY